MNDMAVCDSPVAAEYIASPNHGERLGHRVPDAIILHYTGMASERAALRRLCAPSSGVSAHYFVCECGRVVQMVPESRRAWHAGVGVWRGEQDLNSASIGIEIANVGHDGGLPPFNSDQILALIGLCRDVVRRLAIAPERVLGHSDIAPARKRDPGERFPWKRLAQSGVGHWIPPAPLLGPSRFKLGDTDPQIRLLQEQLAAYGYGVNITGQYDSQTLIVLTAFQRRFRPARVDGEPDESTIETLKALLRL
jgi:N-acetylmuramoyl-L-alanine amidase